MSQSPSVPELGIEATGFDLPATDGKSYSLVSVMDKNGAVIVFICNHCPYVKAITSRLVLAADTLRAEGIGFAAICANDSILHPADSFENMKRFADERSFTFPYLHDESQEVARAYDAKCTPDFFGVNSNGEIQYRGRLDEGRTEPPGKDAKRELVEAMLEISKTGKGPNNQIASIGCGIKWK